MPIWALLPEPAPFAMVNLKSTVADAGIDKPVIVIDRGVDVKINAGAVVPVGAVNSVVPVIPVEP